MPYIGQGLEQGRRQLYTFTATANQTTFSAAYSSGFVDVYQNGILLAPSDYTATNGTSIVLATGAALNDEITIIAQHLFSVADTVSASQGGIFSGNVTVTGNLTVQGTTITVDTSTAQTLAMGDDDKIKLGDDGDLEIYHDGSNSYIDDAGTGSIFIRSGTTYFQNAAGNKTAIATNAGAQQTLYHNNDKKFETESAGVAIHEDTDKVIRFTGAIGEIGSVTGFQATNTAASALTSFGIRATDIRFATGSAERVRISSGGNVGIGTNSPTAGFRTSIKGDYSSVVGGIEFDSGGGDKFTVGHASATSPSAKLNVVGAGHLIMATNNTERVRIAHTTGNVGIGTDSPGSKLHIQETASAGTGILLTNDNNTAGTYSDLKWQYSVADSSYASGLRFKQVDTTHGGQIEFYTDNPSGTFTKQMEITENGHVTTPNQPSCSCYNMGFGSSATSWSSAGSGSVNGGLVGVAHHNNGNHYNTSTGYFTAPVAGYYLCNLNVYGKKDNNHGDNSGYWWGYFQKNGGFYYGNYIMEAYYNSGDYDQGASTSAIIYLAVNDTVRPYLGAYIHGVQVYGPNTGFSCQLLG